MKARVEPHSCADEMWRHNKYFGEIMDCSCGRIFEHRPLTLRALFAVWRKKVPALGGDVWVDVTRRERKRRKREAKNTPKAGAR